MSLDVMIEFIEYDINLELGGWLDDKDHEVGLGFLLIDAGLN